MHLPWARNLGCPENYNTRLETSFPFDLALIEINSRYLQYHCCRVWAHDEQHTPEPCGVPPCGRTQLKTQIHRHRITCWLTVPSLMFHQVPSELTVSEEVPSEPTNTSLLQEYNNNNYRIYNRKLKGFLPGSLCSALRASASYSPGAQVVFIVLCFK